MAEYTIQGARQKILTRFSVSIYKMTDEQLLALLTLTEELGINSNNRLLDIPKMSAKDISLPGDRQLLIAHFFVLIKQMSDEELDEFLDTFEKERFRGLREYPRIPCNINVDFVVGDRVFNCFAKDISAGGVFIETTELFSVNQDVSMCFALLNQQLPFKIKGKVVRLTDSGIGIMYEQLSTYQREILSSLIDRVAMQFKRKCNYL